MRRWWPLLVVYLGLALLLVQMHNERINSRRSERRAERHEQILTGKGEGPWAYRILVPATTEALSISLEKLGLTKSGERETGYLVWRFACTFAIFILFHRFLENWVEPPWALAGTGLLAALHGPSYSYYWFQPALPLDMVLWTAVALVTLARRDFWLLPIIAVGALNRETIVFAIGVHACLRFGHEPLRRLVLRCAGLSAAAGAVLLALRWMIPIERWAAGKTAWDFLKNNFTHSDWLAYAITFVGAFVILAVVGFGRLPRELKLLCLLMVPYLALQLLFGQIREVRLLMPTMLALMPASLLLIRAAARSESH